MPTTIAQIDSLEKLLAQYSDLTELKIALLIIVLAAVWMIIQTWINRARVKATAATMQMEAKSKSNEIEQRAATERALLELITRQQNHSEEFERYIREDDTKREGLRTEAHAALAKMSEATLIMARTQEAMKTMMSDFVQTTEERNRQIVESLDDLAEHGTVPVQSLAQTTQTMMNEVIVLRETIKAMSLDTTGRLDALIAIMAAADAKLDEIKRDIDLTQQTIRQDIAEACKEKEKRRTDSKPIVLIPLPAEDDPDKQEATG